MDQGNKLSQGIDRNNNIKSQKLTDDGHEGVKVADVEAFTRHVDKELDDSGSVLLLHRL